MKIRYIGPDPEVLLPIAGAALVCKRRRWFDPGQAAEDVFVPAVHVEIVVAGLNPAEWEIDRSERKGRARHEPPPSTDPEPPAVEPEAQILDGEPPSDPQE